jgi:heme-degrading monooxygenase HmoA
VFVVLSKFKVANGPDLTAGVKEAFVHRPRLIENTPGFVRLDVLSPLEEPDEIWLLTYWQDEVSFRSWYRTHQYQAVHQNIPLGLKLMPNETALHYFEYIGS